MIGDVDFEHSLEQVPSEKDLEVMAQARRSSVERRAVLSIDFDPHLACEPLLDCVGADSADTHGRVWRSAWCHLDWCLASIDSPCTSRCRRLS
jgi:hypothetical protein